LIAYLLFFFLPAGFFGGHHWYLRNYGRAISYPGLGGVMVALMIYYRDTTPPTNFFVVGLTVYFLSWGFDAVTLAWQVGRSNRRIEREIIKSLKGLNSDHTQDPSFQSASTGD